MVTYGIITIGGANSRDLVTGEINVEGADTIHDRRLKGSVKCGVSDT